MFVALFGSPFLPRGWSSGAPGPAAGPCPWYKAGAGYRRSPPGTPVRGQSDIPPCSTDEGRMVVALSRALRAPDATWGANVCQGAHPGRHLALSAPRCWLWTPGAPICARQSMPPCSIDAGRMAAAALDEHLGGVAIQSSLLRIRVSGGGSNRSAFGRLLGFRTRDNSGLIQHPALLLCAAAH